MSLQSCSDSERFFGGGALYLNHKNLTGLISHARKFLSFSGIGE